jgi:hypothetical protein
MRHVIPALVCITLVGASVVGCAGVSGGSRAESDGLAHAEYAASDPGTGDGALLTGTVEDSEGCLTVRESTTDTLYTPAFPDSGEAAQDLQPGDEISFGGGAHDDLPDGVTLPADCSESGPFWLVVEDR